MVKKNDFYLDKIVKISLIVMIGIFFLTMIFLNTNRMLEYLHSDIVGEMNLSQAIWEQKKIIPDGWYYATEVILLRPSLIAAILYGITKNLILSYGLACTITMGLIIISFIYMIRPITKDFKIVSAGILILIGIGSAEYTGSIFLHMAYYGINLVFTMCTVGYYLRICMDTISKRQRLIMFSIMNIGAFLFGIMSIRMLQMIYIPLMICEIFRMLNITNNFTTYPQKKDVKISFEVIGYIILSIMGLVVFKVFFEPNIYLGVNATNQLIVSLDEIFNRLEEVFKCILELFSFKPNIPLVSIEGINSMIAVCWIVLLGIASQYIITQNYRQEERNVLIIFISSALLTIVVMTLVTVDLATRYVMIYVPLLAIICVIMLNNIGNKKNLANIIYIGVLGCCILNFISTYVPMIKNKDGNSLSKQICRWLEENNYKYVYGEFWKTGILKGISNGKIEAGLIHPGDLTVMKWLTNKEIYAPFNDAERVAILLSDEEENRLKEIKHPILSIGTKVHEIEEINIYSYEKNPIILVEIPKKVGEVVTYNFGQTGFRIMEGAMVNLEDYSVESDEISQGFLIYGPYISIDKGTYNFKIEYEAMNTMETNLGFFDIVSDFGQKEITKHLISNETTYLNIENIIFNQEDNVEFRVYKNAGSKIKVKSITIEKTE